MEIGHNVMHGQWDWMNDPQINSSTWDWDSASTAEAWKHSHNYVHHTYTNIRGKDKDLGYEIMRIDPAQPWNPVYLAQPFYNLVLAALFEWGVAVHDLDIEALRKGHKSKSQLKRELKGIAGKAKSQIVKDYISWPLVSALAAAAVDAGVEARRNRKQPRGLLGRARRRKRGNRWTPIVEAAVQCGAKTFRQTAKADATANIVRNVWSYAIIFCGHFPDQTYTFRPPAHRLRQHRGRPALPRRQRQPQLPGRASPLSRHALDPLCGDRAPGERHLRALWPPVQQRPVPAAAGDGPADDPPPRPPRRQAAAEAGALPRGERRGLSRLSRPRSGGSACRRGCAGAPGRAR
jgi:fatty acid desaturase